MMAEARYKDRMHKWREREKKHRQRKWNRAKITWTQTGEHTYRADVKGADQLYFLCWNHDDAFDDERWELRSERQMDISGVRLAWWEHQPTLPQAETRLREHLTESGARPGSV